MGFLSRTYRPTCGMFEPPVKGKGDVIIPPHGTIDWGHRPVSFRKTFAVNRSQDYSLGD